MAVTLPDPADKAAVVEAMFDRIAPRYDCLNSLLTFRLDRHWRRAAIRRARIGPGDTVVDLGCGTGDMCELAAAAGARVIGIDFAAGMLAGFRRRGIRAGALRADAAALPLRSASATVITSAFALRNFVSIRDVLSEAARVLSPGGRLVILEVDAPRGALSRWGHSLYFRRVVPAVGGLLSDRAAYSYLPQSVAYLPPADELVNALGRSGWQKARKHRLGSGAAQLITAER